MIHRLLGALLCAATAPAAAQPATQTAAPQACGERAAVIERLRSGYGEAPVPPIASDELKAIGWANDAILYAGRVTLWVDAEDDQLAEIGPKVPSSGSADHGVPFGELFARYGDFYKIDPLLFSPAEVAFQNLRTGRCHLFGAVEPEIFRKSIGL